MAHCFKLAILSDIHYASAAEQARGDDYEYRDIHNPIFRHLFHAYRHFIWMRRPLRNNAQLERFLAGVGEMDYVVANGDYTCGTGFVGISDAAARQSARECLGKLREKFGGRLRLTFGDHELGKLSMTGERGGMRLESWRRAIAELGLQRFWRLELGNYVMFGIVSSLVALPIFVPDQLPEEQPAWQKLRKEHMTEIRAAFSTVQPHQRIFLFCHDPTALPFLLEEEAVRARLPQIEQTIIGHLHSNLYLWKSQVLAGMPIIRFLGPSIRRMSTALNQARAWRPFHVRLCPSLAGIELLKDGGYYTLELDAAANSPARFTFHRLRR